MRIAALLTCLALLACGGADTSAPGPDPPIPPPPPPPPAPPPPAPITRVDLRLSGEEEDALPWSINDAGTIVGERGSWYAPSDAFRWTPRNPRDTAGTVINLPHLPDGLGRALGINNAGQIAGYSMVNGSELRGFVYDGQLHDLGLPAGFIHSAGYKLNDAEPRLLIGAGERPSEHVALVWTVSGSGAGFSASAAEELPALAPGGTGLVSDPWGVNDAGVVVGGANNALGRQRPVRWQPAAGVWEVAELAIPPGYTSGFANDINANGRIVGYLNGLHQCTVAVTWSSSTGTAVALPGLGGNCAFAQAINDAGDIAGSSQGPQGSRAVLWTLRSGGYTIMDLGLLPETVWSVAKALNEPVPAAGGTSVEVTGWSSTDAGAYRATLWKVFRPTP